MDGTRHVLEAANKQGGCRVIHCSTVGVHGAVRSFPADESAPFAPEDIYQETKLEGELLAAAAFSDGLPGTIFRPVGIYGPGDTRFLRLFKAIHAGHFLMLGDGKALYHLTFIEDLIEGIILCGEHPAAVGETYILAGPRYTTIRELTDLIARVLGRSPRRGHLPMWPFKVGAVLFERVCRPLGIEPPLHRRRLDFFVKDRAFSSAKARVELGWEPQVDLSQGLARTAEWYFEQGLLRR